MSNIEFAFICPEHTLPIQFVCLDNVCKEKLLCNSCKINKPKTFQSRNSILIRNISSLKQLQATTSIHIPYKLENMCDNLLRTFKGFADLKPDEQMGEMENTLRVLEGVNRQAKRTIYTEKFEITKTFLEQEHIAPIIKQLRDLSNKMYAVANELEVSLKSWLEQVLFTSISQENLLKKEYKQYTAKQIFEALINGQQQELKEFLIGMHQGDLELQQGEEEFKKNIRFLSSKIDTKINLFQKKLESFLPDLLLEVKNMLKEMNDDKKIQLLNQKDLNEMKFKQGNQDLLNEVYNCYLGDQIYEIIFNREYQDDEDTTFDERKISEAEWVEVSKQMKEIVSQKNFESNQLSKNRQVVLRKVRTKKQNDESDDPNFAYMCLQKDVESLLYYDKALQKQPSHYEQLRRQSRSQSQKTTRNLRFQENNGVEKQIINQDQRKIKQTQQIKVEQQEKNINYSQINYQIAFSMIRTIQETLEYFKFLQMEYAKQTQIIDQNFIKFIPEYQQSISEKIVQILQIPNNTFIIGLENGDLQIWEYSLTQPNTLILTNTIHNTHLKLKYLMQTQIPGMILTSGRVDNHPDYVLKIWLANDKQTKIFHVFKSNTYENVYEYHTLNIVILKNFRVISQKSLQEGCKNQLIAIIKPGSCGVFQFASFCPQDEVRIWRISYYGGKISKSKLSQIQKIPASSVVGIHGYSENIIVITTEKIIRSLFNENFTQLLCCNTFVLKKLNNQTNFLYYFGKKYFFIIYQDGAVHQFGVDLEIKEEFNIIHLVQKFLELQIKQISKYSRLDFEQPQVSFQESIGTQRSTNTQKDNFYIIVSIKCFDPKHLDQCVVTINNVSRLEQLYYNNLNERRQDKVEQFLVDLHKKEVIGQFKGDRMDFPPNQEIFIKFDEKIMIKQYESNQLQTWFYKPAQKVYF